MSSLLPSAVRLMFPATFSNPWAAVLVPALLYVATRRELEVNVHLR